jgi:hypothetical protein
VHFLRNALDHLSTKHGDDCLQEFRWLYDRCDLAEAKADLAAWLSKWSARYPRLTTWVEETIECTLTFFRLPRQHHKHLKSTNMLERLNEEIRRRTYVVRIFPNSQSCLRHGCAGRALSGGRIRLRRFIDDRRRCMSIPIVRTVAELRTVVAGWRGSGDSVADLAAYPRTENEDAAKLAPLGVQLLYVPHAEEMYPAGFATTVSVSGVSEDLCGAFWPGHFDGVATVVAKLFFQTGADFAFLARRTFSSFTSSSAWSGTWIFRSLLSLFDSPRSRWSRSIIAQCPALASGARHCPKARIGSAENGGAAATALPPTQR